MKAFKAFQIALVTTRLGQFCENFVNTRETHQSTTSFPGSLISPPQRWERGWPIHRWLEVKFCGLLIEVVIEISHWSWAILHVSMTNQLIAHHRPMSSICHTCHQSINLWLICPLVTQPNLKFTRLLIRVYLAQMNTVPVNLNMDGYIYSMLHALLKRWGMLLFLCVLRLRSQHYALIP